VKNLFNAQSQLEGAAIGRNAIVDAKCHTLTKSPIAARCDWKHIAPKTSASADELFAIISVFRTGLISVFQTGFARCDARNRRPILVGIAVGDGVDERVAQHAGEGQRHVRLLARF
jgi:hypothetical protein